MLGKKNGGERVIGLLTMVARVWSQARETDVQGWAEDTCPAWDAAVKGNSAVFEAFVRAVDEEACTALGFAYAHAMLDFKSFYDSMGWVKLGRAALKLGFPPAILALELQQCLAARVLVSDRTASLAFQPSRSIVQGLRSGTRFARCLAFFIMTRVTRAASPPCCRRASGSTISRRPPWAPGRRFGSS